MEIKNVITGIVTVAAVYLVYDKLKELSHETEAINLDNISSTITSIFDDVSIKRDDQSVFDMFVKESRRSLYSSDKLSYIQKIYNMASNKDSTAKAAAINAINNITKDLIYNNDREKAMEYIAKLY